VNHSDIWRNLGREERLRLLLDKGFWSSLAEINRWDKLPYIVRKTLEGSTLWPKPKSKV
jgi:hypothetical protein